MDGDTVTDLALHKTSDGVELTGVPGGEAPHDRRAGDANLIDEVNALREGVMLLTDTVQALNRNYAVVQDMQSRQQDIDGRTAEAVRSAAEALSAAKDVRSVVVPREEVERGFMAQAEAATEQMRHSNNRTLLMGVVLLLITVLVVVGGIAYSTHRTDAAVDAVNSNRASNCQATNARTIGTAQSQHDTFAPYLAQELRMPNPDPVIVQILTTLVNPRVSLLTCPAPTGQTTPNLTVAP